MKRTYQKTEPHEKELKTNKTHVTKCVHGTQMLPRLVDGTLTHIFHHTHDTTCNAEAATSKSGQFFFLVDEKLHKITFYKMT